MSSFGWIKLHRELTEKAIWLESTPEQKTILITLLMMANHEEKEWEWKGEKYTAKQGQFITSLPSIVKKSGYGITIQNVRTALKRFEKYDFLTDESTNRNRLITIVNWGVYQSKGSGDNTQPNRQLTGNQQATNRQLTANKNDKNYKNDKNDKKESSPKYNFEQHHLKLAELLFKKIKENNPNAKEPIMESWANTFRLIMERDKREGKELQEMIIWTQQHDFWYKNILSPTNLRKQYDRLLVQMKDDKKLKIVNGGMKHAEGSYQTDYTKYDFSKQGNVSWLPERS